MSIQEAARSVFTQRRPRMRKIERKMVVLYLGQLLLNNVTNDPLRTAVISCTRTLTYYELNRESNCIANALTKRGIKKGDTAGIVLKNSAEWVIAWFACQKLGVVFVPLHVRLRAEELVESMRMVQCKLLFFGESLHEKAKEICKSYEDLQIKICVGAPDSAYPYSSEYSLSWEDLLREGDEREAQIKLENDSPVVVLFTSGTTGAPKGVVRTQEQVVLHGMTLAMENNHPGVRDVMLSTAPLYHIGGLQGFLKMLVLGGTYITLERIHPPEVFHMIETWQVTQLQMLPPVTYERLYRYDGWSQKDRSSVWEVCISAGKCTRDYIEHVFELFPQCHLRPSWGSTETCSVTCMQVSREAYRQNPALLKAVGRVIPLNELRIVDERGRDVKKGQSGEAVVRSPMVFKGYIGQQEEDKDIFLDNEWFRTGDIVRADPKNDCYYFLDRKKDVIKTGGENVFALEVERALQEHPAVRDCAVVGIPDPRFGEAIAAAVVTNPGFSVNGMELAEFCKKKLPSFKKPRYLALMEKLPVNNIGKIAKPVLREQAEQLFAPIFTE